MNQEIKTSASASSSEGKGATPAGAKKRSRKPQPLPDRILKFARIVGSNLHLVGDEPELAQEASRLYDKSLHKYVEYERQRGRIASATGPTA